MLDVNVWIFAHWHQLTIAVSADLIFVYNKLAKKVGKGGYVGHNSPQANV